MAVIIAAPLPAKTPAADLPRRPGLKRDGGTWALYAVGRDQYEVYWLAATDPEGWRHWTPPTVIPHAGLGRVIDALMKEPARGMKRHGVRR